MNLKELRRPFDESEIEWRIGQAGEGKKGLWAKCLAYVTNRAIQDRLDEVCGPENWCNRYEGGPDGGVVCGISIRLSGEWVTKWDGAPNTDFESIKGGLSDSMKRAAVQWGIGRYLYGLDEGWAAIGEDGSYFASCKIKTNGSDRQVSFRWSPPQLPGWALPEQTKPAAPASSDDGAGASPYSEEWEKYCEWLNKTFKQAIRDQEPWESWDEIDQYVGSLFDILEPAGLTTTIEGEVVCDWDKLRACHDGSVFKAICKSLKEESKRKTEAVF